MPKQTLLKVGVVDDHPIVIAGLQAMLARENRIRASWTAVNAATVGSDWPEDLDIILLDLNIPGETYPANIRGLRDRFPRTHLVAYTSYNYPDLIRETIKLGCSGYLLKQTSREDLLGALDTIMSGEQYIGTEQKAVRPRAVPKGGTKGKPAPLRDDFQKRQLLSKREKEILNLISKGFTSQQMADDLFISRYTVETHRKNILRKLNFGTSTELVKFAVEHGLV